MTPMQALKTSFDQFKALIPFGVEQAALNKSEDSVFVDMFCADRQGIFKKGVRSDFVKFFKSHMSGGIQSLGFSFAYLDLAAQDQSIQVSLKVGSKDPAYFMGENLGVAAFREILDRSNAQAKAMGSPSWAQVVEIFKANFELKQKHAKSTKDMAKQKRRQPK